MEIPARKTKSRVTRRTSSNSTTAFPTNLTFAYIYEPEIEIIPPEHAIFNREYWGKPDKTPEEHDPTILDRKH
jgi:hypothetical protein